MPAVTEMKLSTADGFFEFSDGKPLASIMDYRAGSKVIVGFSTD